MEPKIHLQSFEERKDTLFKWGVEVRGIENSQRIIGDNASRAIVDLLSAFLHKNHLVETGFQLNHAWFKSYKVKDRLPEFTRKDIILKKMVHLEQLCEKLSYGAPKPRDILEATFDLFKELEDILTELLEIK